MGRGTQKPSTWLCSRDLWWLCTPRHYECVVKSIISWSFLLVIVCRSSRNAHTNRSSPSNITPVWPSSWFFRSFGVSQQLINLLIDFKTIMLFWCIPSILFEYLQTRLVDVLLPLLSPRYKLLPRPEWIKISSLKTSLWLTGHILDWFGLLALRWAFALLLLPVIREWKISAVNRQLLHMIFIK